MGVLTRSELENLVRQNIGGRTDRNNELVSFLNLAQDQMTRSHDFSELEVLSQASTVASQKTLDLPDKPLSVISLRLIRGSSLSKKLIFIPPRRWDKIIPEPEWHVTGEPSYYTVFRDVIEMYRIPNAVYTLRLRWIKRPTPFSTTTDIASDFERKDDIIVSFATSWAFRSLGEHEKADKWWRGAVYSLKSALKQDWPGPDFEISGEGVPATVGEYWKDPFVGG